MSLYPSAIYLSTCLSIVLYRRYAYNLYMYDVYKWTGAAVSRDPRPARGQVARGRTAGSEERGVRRRGARFCEVRRWFRKRTSHFRREVSHPKPYRLERARLRYQSSSVPEFVSQSRLVGQASGSAPLESKRRPLPCSLAKWCLSPDINVWSIL